MPLCPPPTAQTDDTRLQTLMGEHSIQDDMDLAWQEVLSIAELQDLSVQNNSVYDTGGYETQAPIMPYPGYGICHYPDAFVTNPNHNIPTYDRSYADTVPAHPQHLPSLPLGPALGPTAYTGMLISSSMTQISAHGHCPTKNIPSSGLMCAPIMEHTSIPDGAMTKVLSLHQPCKGQDDFESDSGLSLNFSDGESMELENMESQRLRTEYLEMLPPLNFQDQYGLAQTITQPYMSQISETHSFNSAQDLVCTRDELRAAAMNIPFPTERIVNLPVEDFNELLSHYTLTEAQMALVRDIRRRGKNKVAAQNCRKRKMENIAVLEKEIGQLKTEREGLRREQEEVGKLMGDLKQSLALLHQEVVSVLRDQGNHHYQLEDFMLTQESGSTLCPIPLTEETRTQY
ncbi:transcription factor NF-E2 45 kDa subunit [Spea bombifrons]|uniref:transcription factor NF-E2 45 kDa subunit n=1 Tax=Spea bombifrons TaxID=233779 RepID=UPI00234B0018|nr:transcription factor NF-E2 45 kDa subunit [Spea bombifrons]